MNYLAYFLAIFLMSYSLGHAGIIANTTRVIYQETDREQVLNLANTNAYPILTQVWVDDGSANPNYKQSPFVILPAIFRMNPNEIKSVRIIYNLIDLPKDQESLNWINLYEIPAIEKTKLEKDYLSIAMNTQMKIFFRPKNLKQMNLNEISQQLQFHLTAQNQIKLTNPTSYYISLIYLKILDKNNKPENHIAEVIDLNQQQTIAPKKTVLFNVKQKLNIIEKIDLEYVLIDDHGIQHSFNTQITK